MNLEEKQELQQLCLAVKGIVTNRNYEEAEKIIAEAMNMYPHSAIPHNLLGIILEKEDEHSLAMKHFRAAYALEPDYLPARHNLDLYESFYPMGTAAYDEDDCEVLENEKRGTKVKVIQGRQGIKYAVKELMH